MPWGWSSIGGNVVGLRSRPRRESAQSHHTPPLHAPLDRLSAARREVACGAEPPAAYKISTADDNDEKAVSISGRGERRDGSWYEQEGKRRQRLFRASAKIFYLTQRETKFRRFSFEPTTILILPAIQLKVLAICFWVYSAVTGRVYTYGRSYCAVMTKYAILTSSVSIPAEQD